MKRLSLRLICVVVLLTLLSSPFSLSSHAGVPTNQSGPTLLKASVVVRANRLLHYWKAPEVDNYWSWMPEMSFYVTGPINTGTPFVIAFTNKPAAPWSTLQSQTNAT